MSYLRWAGCRVVFSYNSTYKKLDNNITVSTIIKLVVTRYLAYSRWWCMMMKFRPLEPQLGCSAHFISSLRKLVIVTLPSIGSHDVRTRQIFCFWQW